MAENLDEKMQIAGVYARSLFELAQQSGQVDLVRSELEELVELGRMDPMLGEFFRSEALDSDHRAAMMEKWFRGKLSDLTLNTLLVLNDNDRHGTGEAMLRCFQACQEEAAGQVRVTAVAAVELTRPTVDQMLAAIARPPVAAPTPDAES